MVNKNLVSKIFSEIKKAPSWPGPYRDLFGYLRSVEGEDFGFAHEKNKELRNLLTYGISLRENVGELFDVYKKSLLFDAPHYLDPYLLYLELGRDPERRFYQPRRGVLKQVVDALQALADDELDELFLSLPPRTGKSSLMIFFMTWILGRFSENPNLYCSYTDTITKAFYNGVLEILQDRNTYLWHDVFPTAKLVQTNAADETLNIDRKKHYPSLTCRSIDGTINGACDAQDGFIIADDLVSGIEEALSKERLISKWSKVDNNLIPRGKGKTKYLWIGTRWSVLDPAAVRLNVLSTDEKYAGYRYKVINLPALDENDESNFDYPYGVGFDTLYYHRRRASFERNNDIASWDAQYMGEPIEREGTLILPADFKYYNGELPDEEPDRVVLALDPAYGGGDFCAGAICCQYDDELYIPDVIYDDNDKTITLKLIVNAVRRYGINAIQIEANKSTMGYKDELERLLKEEGLKVNLTTKTTPPTTSKAARIFDKAPDIRECCVFLESGKRPRHYDAFMQNVFGFKVFAKNKHDDAPDSLAMLIDMVFRKSEKPVVFKRPF